MTQPTDDAVGGEERTHFLAVAHRLGFEATRRHLALWGVKRFYELMSRANRNSLVLAMTKELFNDPTD